jgi:hypothetical protein
MWYRTASESEVQMNPSRVLKVSLVAALASVGCAASPDSESESREAALTTLAAQCATPTTSEGPLVDSSGQPINGTGKTTLQGCIVGHTGEIGADLLTRAGTLLSSTAKFATLEDSPGHRLFSQFTPGTASGTLETGLVQDVDVKLDEQGSPTTKLRFTRKKTADGLTLKITNVTALVANVLFTVTVVNPNDLSINLTFKSEASDISASGSSQITMQQGQDHAAEASGLVVAFFGWASSQLKQ